MGTSILTILFLKDSLDLINREIWVWRVAK